MAVTEAKFDEMNMDERTLPLLCDPETHDALQLDAGVLLSPKSGLQYLQYPQLF
jgi:hypothetical protein